MNKRKSDEYSESTNGEKKRFCEKEEEAKGEEAELSLINLLQKHHLAESVTKCLSQLFVLRELFPVEKFNEEIPPILLKHQIYSLMENRTEADCCLDELIRKGIILLFKLGIKSEDRCIVFYEDFTEHVTAMLDGVTNVDESLIHKFLFEILPKCQKISLNSNELFNEYGLTDADITQLTQVGLLTVRDAGDWWISIPGGGMFIKSFARGRNAILSMIRRCKYKEIMKEELEKKKMLKSAKLGVKYYIHDIVGADLVLRVSTTSGTLLRIEDDS